MKKYFLLLTIFGQLLPTSSAKSYSWTGMHLKLLPAYSSLKLNYSGDTPFTMNLRKKSLYNSYYSRYNDGFSTHKIAEKVSVNTLTVDYSVGLSAEISDSIGLIGEIGGMIGKTSNFIDSNEALLFNTFVTAGLFYHQPAFRIYGMGGFGIGEDIFGYPRAVELLQSTSSADIKGNKLFVNSTVGFTYRGTIGFDYKIDSILFGVSYIYTRSTANVTLENDETFYISNHAFAATIGAHF
jgi:hypothetical protein